ncbi:MAG: restriction endonuclease subunit S [Lachnospiraceae bacterium]|nr:restriction endonuclease subunit S [Lachnospiraceae bacterium]
MYQNLLEGLEVSVVPLGEIVSCERFDSEYYRKTLRSYQAKITSIEHKTLEEIADFLIGPFGSAFNTENYVENGKYRYVRGKDVKPFILANNDNRYVPKEDYFRLNKYALREKDILVSVVGTLGNACIVTRNDLPAIFSCKSSVIRCRETNPYFLLAYLNCKNGKQLLARNERGANQKGLNLPDIQKLPVPIFSSDFQEVISNIVCLAYDKSANSGGEYHKAENLLLHELGLTDHTPSNEQISIRSIRDIAQTGRIDAEYYQPKYDAFEKTIKEYENGYTTPGSSFELIKTKCLRDLPEYPYVEIGDIDIGTGSAEYHIIPTSKLPANAKIMTQKDDLIVSTVRPYRGAVAILKENDLLVSGAFTVLRSKSCYPVQTLQVLFRTQLYKDWLLKYNVGTSYPVIKDEDILNIPIPVFKNEIHDRVKEYVCNSQEMIIRSKELLECAKRAVEMAIEQDEESAIQYLNSQLQ